MTDLTEATQAAWRGKFGDEYTDRVRNTLTVAENADSFREFFKDLPFPESVIEFGCSQGMNLQGIAEIAPDTLRFGIEINEYAAGRAISNGAHVVQLSSLQDAKITQDFDLAFTRGVLIHIPPADLPGIYDKLYLASNRWILIAEYFAPRSEEIVYRGNAGMMWRGNFAGDFMRQFPDVKLVRYGFQWKEDPRWTQQDDQTWFLMEKPQTD